MKDKLRSKRFWLSLCGTVIMLLQLFGVKIDVPYVNEIINSICAVLVLIGLMDDGGGNDKDQSIETSDQDSGLGKDAESKEDSQNEEGVRNGEGSNEEDIQSEEGIRNEEAILGKA